MGTLLLIIIFILPLTLISLFLGQNKLIRLKYKLPPGPAPWPVVGNIYDIKPVRFRCFHEWAQQYGPIISFWLGSKLNIVVSSSEMAKQVLKEHDQVLADRHRSRSSARFSKNGLDLIWADYGPHYVKVRKACTLELFTQKRLESLRPIREDEVTAMIESVFVDSVDSEKKGKLLKVRRYIGTVSFNNITRLVFGKRFINSKGELDPLGNEFKGILSSGVKSTKTSFLAEHLPWLRWLLVPLDNEKGEAALHNARLDRFTREIMEDHAKAKSNNDVNVAKQQHFVDALLTLKDKYDFSEDTMIGLLWDMVIAGMDTVSISVEWALAELIRNPRVQKKAQEELDRVIGSNRIMTEEDITNLPYLQALAKESLRLHPPTPLMLPHKAKAHVNVGGYDIPKGTIVYVNVWAIARDPNAWTNPNEFRPERFLEEDVDIKGQDFRLLPFGSGRRICPGAQLGINLVTSMLGHLLHHFDWNPPSGVKPSEMDMTENAGLVAYMRTSLQAVANPRLPEGLYKRVPVDM